MHTSKEKKKIKNFKKMIILKNFMGFNKKNPKRRVAL
jgi:hypothetical protein